jgi:hypothetical protein|tara:strand:+ start:112 stop:945 length:834 start_codon:yes stop_codon:yes gene_type:complete
MPLGIARHIITYSGSWSPASSITPAFWIDASDASSYSVSGSNVTAVTDKAGNATITVGGTPNTSSSLDSKTVFHFQANNNEDLTTNEFHQASSGNHWAIGVFQWNNINATKDSFWSTENNTVNATTAKRDYAVSSSDSSAFDGELDLDSLSVNRISSTIGNAQNFDSGIAQDTWKIIGVFFNKAGNQIGARVDGANAFTPVNDYDNSLTPNLDLRIFRNRSSERMSGKLAEFFTVADAPGTGVINMSHFESAEGYLAHKWGLQGLLPADHPHKANAP